MDQIVFQKDALDCSKEMNYNVAKGDVGDPIRRLCQQNSAPLRCPCLGPQNLGMC